MLNKLVKVLFRIKYLSFLSKLLGGHILYTTNRGIKYLLNLNSHIDSRIYLYDGYEQENIDTLINISKSKNCTIFIDIGANIGVFSLQFALNKQFNTIYAFEPDPITYAHLNANIYLNDLKHVKLFKKALSNTKEEKVFYRSTLKMDFEFNKLNTGTNSLEKNKLRHNEEVIIQSEIPDNIFNKLTNEVICIKIDVEGHEESVLLGMINTLKNNHCIVFIEIFEDKQLNIFQIFQELNYNQVIDYNLSGLNFIFTNIE